MVKPLDLTLLKKYKIATYSIFVGIFFVLFPLNIKAEDNIGFVQGLWYDQTEVFSGDAMRIYVAVHNHSGSEMSGTITFYVDEEIATEESIAIPNNRIAESWFDWRPTYGEHIIRAELSQLELSTTNGTKEATTVKTPLAKDIVFVDNDTDNDGIGDQEDTDDDGDGISDKEERRNGTDPYRFNQPEEDTEPKAEVAGISTSTKAGLEQYISNSQVESILGNITDWTNRKKEDLDTYRKERDTRLAIETGDPNLPVDESGFGQIIRTEEEKPVAKKPEGFFGDLFTFIENIVRSLVTLLLTTLSWLLAYPALVQLLLLFAILLGLYKVAKKLGGRPS